MLKKQLSHHLLQILTIFSLKIYLWMVGFWVWPFCASVQKCNAHMGSTHENEVRKMEDSSVFIPVHSCSLICVYIHVCVCSCLSLWHVVSNIFGGLASFSVISRNISTRDNPLEVFLCLSPCFPPFASIPPSHVNGSHHLPFSSPKKQNLTWLLLWFQPVTWWGPCYLYFCL